VSSRVAATLVVVGLLAAAPAARAEGPDRDAIREASAAARSAYDGKDYAGFLLHSRALAAIAPRSTRALYNLACAQSLTGDAAGATATLDRLANWGVAFDIEADTDFDSIRETEGFRDVARRMAALGEPIGSSPVAFTVPERDLLAEGVAHDPKTGLFYVTGVHRRKIVRLDAAGRASDFVTEGRDGLFSAIAVVVDPARRSLWVTTEASPLMVGFRKEDDGGSFLMEYDLETAGLRRRLEPPVPGGRVSDLALGADGTLYAADPVAGRVYRLPPGGDRLEVLVASGPIVSPQGMAASADGRVLFVADYIQGIARMDLATRVVTFLETPESLLVTGIDGLVLAGDSLVGIQNGLRPHRVLRLRLDPSRERIVEGTILERAHPRFDEPTLGVVVGDHFFYVANSQYQHFGRDGSPDLDQLQEPVVLRLALPWLSRD